MTVRLPICIKDNGRVFTKVEIQKPKAGTIIKAEEAVNNSSIYRGMFEIVKGSVTSVIDSIGYTVSEKNEVSHILRKISYCSAEWVSMQILLSISEDDGIEGLYTCRMCQKKILCKRDREAGIDNRDHVKDLPCLYKEDEEDTFFIEFEETIKITGKNADQNEIIIKEVQSITFRNPTIFDCENALRKYSISNKSKLQLGILKESMTEINGEKVKESFRNQYGMILFQNMPLSDINKIGKMTKDYGMKNTVKKVCPDCGLEFDAILNTSNFFASGLQQN